MQTLLDNWVIALLLTFGSLIVLLVSGLPVAFAFLALDVVWIMILWGGGKGLELFIYNIKESITSFSLLPIVLFMLMGEVIYQAGVAPNMMDAVDKWIGRMPGRLSFLAIAGGTLLATLTGTSMASCAMLGSTLMPEMKKRGYSYSMSMGPILGSAGLAVMIPPSGLAVLYGVFAKASIGKLLIGIILPGIVMAIVYSVYVIVRCRLQPALAPPYEAPAASLKDKLSSTGKYILPIAVIVFLVTGVIFLGLATPTEAAATGALGCFLLAAIYGGLKWRVLKKTFSSTVEVSCMMLAILFGADIFSQIMSFTGAITGFTHYVSSLALPPFAVVILIMCVLLFMGMFMGSGAIIMVTTPIFVPIVMAFGYDPIWFGVCYLLNMEMASITPPYGLALFVMKGIAGNKVSMGEVYRSTLPFCYINMGVLALLLVFQPLTTWLPGLMAKF